MKRISLLFLFLFLPSYFYAQSAIELFPGNLNIHPFAANTLEPKLGFLFHTSENELRLDIGNSYDFIHINSCYGTFSFGADLFTYTRLRKEENFHFPVDAVDYLFGINFGYKKDFGCYEIGARLRISHISAHLVDGHYDKNTGNWIDNQLPRVYSREFFELIPYIKYKTFRAYAGATYIFHIDPPYIGKDNYQAGFEYFLPWQPVCNVNPYIAYDFKIIHLDSYSGNNSLIAGIKFGNSFGRGFSLYYQYYSGHSIHGEYFDKRVDYSAIGINLDL